MTYLLWGFSAHHPEPIKLAGGSLRECRVAWRSREAEGWTCAIYGVSTEPTGLRLQAAQL